jgi:hypothetical protein
MSKQCIATLFIFIIVVLSLSSISESEVLCDPENTATYHQTLDQYFSVYLEQSDLMMQQSDEVHRFAKQNKIDTASALAEGERLRKEKYDPKVRALFSKFGITEKEYIRFTMECLHKHREQVKSYLRTHPDISVKLKKIAPNHLFLQEDIRSEEVTLEAIAKFLPAIIAASELRRGNIKLLTKIEETAQADPEKAKQMEKQLFQDNMKTREALLENYAVTDVELSRWHRPILNSLLTHEYIRAHPDFHARFTETIWYELCAEDSSLHGCKEEYQSKIPLSHEDVGSGNVTMAIIEQYLPVIIWESEGFQEDRKKKLKEIAKAEKQDPKKAQQMKEALSQKIIREREEIYRRQKITQEGLETWRVPILKSPLLYEYLERHPNLKIKIGQPVSSCNDDPYQKGCKDFLEEFIPFCKKHPDGHGCENLKKP